MKNLSEQEYIDKWKDALAQRGREIRVVGVLGFVITGYALWALNDTNKYNGSTFIVFLLLVGMLTLFLTYAGRYLIYTPGKATNRLLALSALFMLLLIRGLIPLIVFISILVTLSRYRKDNKTLTNSGRSAWTEGWTIKEKSWMIALILLGLIGYIGGALSAANMPNTAGYGDQTQSTNQ